MTTVIWTNTKIYTKEQILEFMNTIKASMRGMLHLEDEEINALEAYSNQKKIELNTIVNIRNHIRIQREINYDEKYNIRKNITVRKQYFALVSNFNIKSLDTAYNKLFNLIASSYMPLAKFMIVIQDNIINNYNPLFITAMNSIRQRNKETIDIVHKNAAKYENRVVEYFRNLGIKLHTEDEIKEKHISHLTPDILFTEPINIVLNGKSHKIHWIDAKNYILFNINFIMDSLHRQARKYNSAFGNGAFIFRRGIEQGIVIPNTLLLDGHFI